MFEQIWAAGLFEGEGSAVRRERKGRVSLVLLLGSTDEDVVHRLYAALGVGSVSGPYQPKKSPTYKRYWQWSTSCSVALEIVHRPEFISQLSVRRRARIAEIVTEVLNQRPPRRSPLATHCPQNHPYDAENTTVSERGHRTCRKCRRERARERYHAEVPMATYQARSLTEASRR